MFLSIYYASMMKGTVMEPGCLWTDPNGLFKWMTATWKRMVATEMKRNEQIQYIL